MARLTWLGGLAVTLAFALLIVFRGQAAASDAGSCTQIDGYLSFCLNVPLTGARRETSVPLVALPSARADVRVETTVPGVDAAALAVDVDRSVERVEALFGHAFDPRPRVLLFGTSAPFATSAHELFGYSPQTATYVASTYGGIFDRPTATIALNWGASSASRMGAAIEHELSHLMIRQLTGGRDIPVWLDEGIATAIEEDAAADAPWVADEAIVGRAAATSGAASLDDLASLADFHNAYGALGRPLYAYVASAVRAMEERIGWDGVLRLLDGARVGQTVNAGYVAASGETLAALERRLGTMGPEIYVTKVDATGNVEWTVSTGAVNVEMIVRITGGRGYDLTFTVCTDALGLYRGSFGATANPGVYTVRAAGVEATFSTER